MIQTKKSRSLCGLIAPFFVISLIILHSPTKAQDQTFHIQKEVAGAGLKYLLYVPENATQNERLPLLLFLHGGGEGGDDIDKVKTHGPPKLIAPGKKFPFIVVSPQNPSETQFWDDQQILRLLNELETSLPVDRDRVYLTGLSRGAFAAWRLAIQNPDRFAALAPISGGGYAPYAKRIADIPVWVFHGQRDNVIPVIESERMVKALEAAGGNVKFTVYPDAKHDAWSETYDNPELYRWLTQQRRSRGEP